MSAASLSVCATTRHIAYRVLMAGGSIYFIGNAMQATTTGRTSGAALNPKRNTHLRKV